MTSDSVYSQLEISRVLELQHSECSEDAAVSRTRCLTNSCFIPWTIDIAAIQETITILNFSFKMKIRNSLILTF